MRVFLFFKGIMEKKEKIIGLIGGMGPYASAYFYKLLLDKSNQLFGARHNDDFPEILIDSVPVPDFISDTTNLDIAKDMLISRVKRLTTYGCTSLAMVCNTGHILYPSLSQISGPSFVSLIDSVSGEVNKRKLRKVGLFATRTTIRTNLYQDALRQYGIEVVTPDDQTNTVINAIIEDVVARGASLEHSETLKQISEKFVQHHNLDGIILGCTELPLVFPKQSFSNVVDCLDVLAERLLSEYYSADPQTTSL